MVAISRFTRTLATLLASGVPLLTALEIVQQVVGNKVLEEAIQGPAEISARGRASPIR